MKRHIKWQAWKSPDATEITFAPQKRIAEMLANGELLDDRILLHEVVATTGEDAMKQHHELMGWEPYQPMGDPKPCPNHCGGEYYPLGYGECSNCGPVGESMT